MIAFLLKNVTALCLFAAVIALCVFRWRTNIPWYCNILPCEFVRGFSSFNAAPYRWSFFGVIFVCLLPAAAVFLSGVIAERLGCNVSEAGASPCIFCGVDIGGVLANMVVSGWLMLLTLPVAAITAFAWILFEIARFLARYVS